ncbi:hypothetical protein PTSG_02313 [Salpingoeca rosetta]|uniref:Pentacotripeptide-repeat region of PRORP domain-containing protein n=1 Tax=Salpingoeca rosetta (strain ATCC 50818 / BSB-021) TaxID=946362 RepID=F2U1U6_SALR5|nr:uncharacterized protein PTSG_02313 [Salpingoeca rosetta]EGD81598.1 hypothetical protein PTSG_02313 [Salpingoeca rosetta]|eukprot:XP_004996802.1 hypothetical protein PTSG_02313 [Salpingoeca rosetta]
MLRLGLCWTRRCCHGVAVTTPTALAPASSQHRALSGAACSESRTRRRIRGCSTVVCDRSGSLMSAWSLPRSHAAPRLHQHHQQQQPVHSSAPRATYSTHAVPPTNEMHPCEQGEVQQQQQQQQQQQSQEHGRPRVHKRGEGAQLNSRQRRQHGSRSQSDEVSSVQETIYKLLQQGQFSEAIGLCHTSKLRRFYTKTAWYQLTGMQLGKSIEAAKAFVEATPPRLAHPIILPYLQLLLHQLDPPITEGPMPWLQMPLFDRSPFVRIPGTPDSSVRPDVLSLLHLCAERGAVTKPDGGVLLDTCKRWDTRTETAMTLLRNGIGVHPRVYNAMLTAYKDSGDHARWQALSALLVKHNLLNTQLTTSLLSIMSKDVDTYAPEHMLAVFKAERKPNVRTYTALLDGMARRGEVDTALEILQVMQKSSMKPNAITFSLAALACARSNRTHALVQVLNMMHAHGMSISTDVFASIIANVAAHSTLTETDRVWDLCTGAFGVVPDVRCYTGIIHAHLLRSQHHRAVDYIADMHARGVKPDGPLRRLIKRKLPSDYAHMVHSRGQAT